MQVNFTDFFRNLYLSYSTHVTDTSDTIVTTR